MIRRLIILGCVIVLALGIFVVPFPGGVIAMALVSVLAGGIVIAIRKFSGEREFLTDVFLAALLLRLVFGIFIDVFDVREFFGLDALGYHSAAAKLVDDWTGKSELSTILLSQTAGDGAYFWGIFYLIAAIYYLVGPNMFVAQSLFALVGAATAPLVFVCSRQVFGNLRAAKFAAVSIAVFPSFVLWSSQLLKDGLIVFLLVATMIMVLQLQKKFSYSALGILVISLLGILSLRFYIFYAVIVAVVGSFLINLSQSRASFIRNGVVLLLVGFVLTYFGAGRRAVNEYQVFGNLERLQMSRVDLATSAESGYGADADVSTAEGALSTLPLGFAYLMLAPFPWEVRNLRQAITIPEILIWWSTLPFFVIGLIYTIMHRLRKAFPMLIFMLLLTLAYSLFQGNVGTAYRQRTQIQVFMFILIGVGWIVYKEKKENERLIRQAAQRQVDDRLRAGRLVTPKVTAERS